MMFLTNRTFIQGDKSDPGRKVSFDLDDNKPNHSMFFCERQSKNDYVELGSDEFLRRVKEVDKKQVLIYIHGYSNMPEPDIFPRAEALQDLFDAYDNGLVMVIPAIWPCDNDRGAVKDYWDDQQAADMSAIAFSRMLQRFDIWREKNGEGGTPCFKYINILAHSMGNRVLRGAVKAWGKYHRAYRMPLIFRNVFMVAADVVNESLERGKSGALICDSTRSVSVYYASDDLALRGSKMANLKNRIASRRLGHTGPEDMSRIPDNVYAIDCDEYNTRYDSPKGHSYFLEDPKSPRGAGKVFLHIYESLRTGRVSTNVAGQKKIIL